jgi:DNA-binding CsgD family transcriptional regulator
VSRTDAVLDLVGEAYAHLDLESFQEGLLAALERAIPCDWTSLNSLAPGPDGEVVSIARPPVPLELYDVYARYAHTHPLVIRFLETGDGRPLRISDVVDRQAFHRLDLYREVYAPIGLEHQLAFTLPAPAGHVLGVVLSRRFEDFTVDDCALLREARPHLIQAYRNALEHTEVLRRLGAAPALPPPDLRAHGLTEREAEVVRRVASGRSNRDIASELALSERTVQKHLERSYRKLGVTSRSEAARLAWRSDGGAPVAAHR